MKSEEHIRAMFGRVTRLRRTMIVLAVITLAAAGCYLAFDYYNRQDRLRVVTTAYSEAVRIARTTYVKTNMESPLGFQGRAPETTETWIQLLSTTVGKRSPDGGDLFGVLSDDETGRRRLCRSKQQWRTDCNPHAACIC
mgnify:CR=1 FL=1|jgi:hypothetical protein